MGLEFWRIKEELRDRYKYYTKIRKMYTGVHGLTDVDIHLSEAIAWLCRAQDHGIDRGVSWGTKLGYGFLESYPETTGYIIPTFIDVSEHYGNEEYLHRASDMGDWEIEVQMNCGAVMGGKINDNPTPAVFNTGQVIIGWCSLFKKTKERRFLEAALKAANWMLDVQDPDGSWYKGNSKFANESATLYNLRAGWGLGLLGITIDEPKYIRAAIKNADYTLGYQQKNGFFEKCCLDYPETPLIHTQAYTMRGMFELCILTGDDRYIDSAVLIADSFLRLVRKDGSLPGRINRDFTPAVSWSTMTGNAQTSIVWLKLYKLTKNRRYLDGAMKVNRYLMRRHDISSLNPAVRGGVLGSSPSYGDYGRFCLLNWATKFFVDSLLLQKKVCYPEAIQSI